MRGSWSSPQPVHESCRDTSRRTSPKARTGQIATRSVLSALRRAHVRPATDARHPCSSTAERSAWPTPHANSSSEHVSWSSPLCPPCPPRPAPRIRCGASTGCIASQIRHGPPAATLRKRPRVRVRPPLPASHHAPALWDGLESRVPQRRGGVSAEPRTISRAAPPRTCLPGAPAVCRVRANPQNRPSSRGVRRRDLRPGHGIPRHAKQRGAGSARNYRFKLAAGDPAAGDESPAAPADQNGRRPQKGRRSQQTAGNPAARFGPQPPPADQNGMCPRGVADVPLTKGNRGPRQQQARDQCRRRPQGRNRVRIGQAGTFDREPRSASTERKHRSNASQFLTVQFDHLPPAAHPPALEAAACCPHDAALRQRPRSL